MTITRFRLKGAVEAVRWTGGNSDELAAFTAGRFYALDPEDRDEDPDATGCVCTSVGGAWEAIHPGTWIVKAPPSDASYAVPDEVGNEWCEAVDG